MALLHDVLRQEPKAAAVSVLQLLALADVQKHPGGKFGALCKPINASPCRSGPFGASASHGFTASESPLYMDLAGCAFFSLSHGGYEPAQVRPLSEVCLAIWHESACQEFAYAPVAVSKPAPEGTCPCLPSDTMVHAYVKATSLVLSCADRALAAKHAQPPHSPTAGIALRMRDAAAAQALVQVRRNMGVQPMLPGSITNCSCYNDMTVCQI